MHAGSSFVLHDTCSITDDQLVACLRPRGVLNGGSVEFLFLNCCGTLELAQQVQRECGIPVVVAWADAVVPATQCVALVRAHTSRSTVPAPAQHISFTFRLSEAHSCAFVDGATVLRHAASALHGCHLRVRLCRRSQDLRPPVPSGASQRSTGDHHSGDVSDGKAGRIACGHGRLDVNVLAHCHPLCRCCCAGAAASSVWLLEV